MKRPKITIREPQSDNPSPADGLIEATGSDNEEQRRANHGAKSKLAPVSPNTTIDEDIRKMLDSTILDWNRPSQLENINADTNYNKLIPVIKALINTAVEEALLKLKEEMKMHTVPESTRLITRTYLNNSIDFMIQAQKERNTK